MLADTATTWLCTTQVTLAGFRKAQFQVLVATDVAARGLDISGVELVLQTSVPKEHETYIHRCGPDVCNARPPWWLHTRQHATAAS